MLVKSHFKKVVVLWIVLTMSLMALTLLAPEYESSQAAEVDIEQHESHCSDYVTVELENKGSYEQIYVTVSDEISPVMDESGETVTVMGVQEGDDISVVGVDESGSDRVFRTYEHS